VDSFGGGGESRGQGTGKGARTPVETRERCSSTVL